jgi:hypothetical protein
MGSALIRIPGKPHVHFEYGRWLLRRPPASPIVAASVRELTDKLAIP